MEEYLRLAKIKSQQLDLNVKSNLAHSLGTLPSKGCIEVEEKGRMKVLKVIGDGNCQFRSVALLLTGIDDDENHKVLRKKAVEGLEKMDKEYLRRSLQFTHHKNDCITPRSCEKREFHSGAIISSSVKPYKRIVQNQDELVTEMTKDKTWGNEYTSICLAEALEVKLNLVQKHPKKDVFKVTHCICPDGQIEVNILFSHEGGHYEALVPSMWNLTGESSSQSSSQPVPAEVLSSDPESNMSIGDRKKILKKRSFKLKAKLSPHVNLIKNKKQKKKAPLPDFNTWYNEEVKKSRKPDVYDKESLPQKREDKESSSADESCVKREDGSDPDPDENNVKEPSMITTKMDAENNLNELSRKRCHQTNKNVITEEPKKKKQPWRW